MKRDKSREKVKAFLLTREWDERKVTNEHSEKRKNVNQLELTFWCYSSLGPVRVRIEDQSAVLFVTETHAEEAFALLAQRHSSISPNLTLRLEGEWHYRKLTLKTFGFEEVYGIYFSSQRDLYRTREVFHDRGIVPYEADIAPTDRYLMERFIRGGLWIEGDTSECDGCLEFINPRMEATDAHPNFRIVSLDIETSITDNSLYSIGLIGIDQSDAERCEKHVFVIGDNKDDSAPDYLEYVDNERGLIVAFLCWITEYDPDIIIGWSVINFDLRVLQKRADFFGLSMTLGRANALMRWRQSKTDGEHFTLLVPGRSVLDGIETLKSATYNFESFSLEYVANHFLERGKLITNVHNRGQEITELFNKDKVALAAYNLEDCQLVWDIFVKAKLIDFAIERASLTGLAFDRFGGSVAAFDNRYLPRLHRRGYVAPNLPIEPVGVGSPGGYVMDSIPGLYRHVLVLDFKSLYPSIIRTFKIDPLALIVALDSNTPANGAILNESSEESRSAETPCTDVASYVPGFRGALFDRASSILPEIISELWLARDEARAANNAALSQAIKILMNSFYGVLGTPGCRFFDCRLPSSITLRGHEILYKTKALIEEKGYQVIYGDTDSVFVWLKGLHPQILQSQLFDIGRELETELNSWWKEYLYEAYQLESFLQLEFETCFLQFLMPTIRGSEKGSKKRYAGLAVQLQVGEKRNAKEVLIFKGLEAVRTDWTPLARQFQRELYRRVFYQEPYEDYIRQIVNRIRKSQCDGDLYYRKRIRRPLSAYQKNVPPHVQAARIENAVRGEQGLDEKYKRGGWIRYVLTVNGPEPEAFQRSPLDYDLYIERQIKPIVDGVAQFLNTSFDSIAGQQMGLF